MTKRDSGRVARWTMISLMASAAILAGCGSNGGTNTGGLGGSSGLAGAPGAGGNTGVGGESGAGGGGGSSAGMGGTAAGGSGAGGGGTAGGSGAGGGGTAGSAGGGGGTSPGGAAGTTSAAGGAAGGVGATGGAGGAVGSKVGMIVVTQTVTASSVSASVVASFVMMTEMNPCKPSVLGSCRLYNCGTTGGGSPKTFFQAGSVSITGLAADLPLTYATDSMMYRSAPVTAALWSVSRPATATVLGSGDVPPFTLAVTAPNPISVTTPAAASGASYKISKATDLAVTWTGGVEGTVEVALSSGSGASLVSIDCSAPATSGTLTIPASLLGFLGTSGGFSAAAQNVALMPIGAWMMQFSASTLKDQGAVSYTN